MLDLNATQQALVASSYKEIAWLFEVTTTAPVTYYWSTQAVSFGGQDYAFKIPAASWRGLPSLPQLFAHWGLAQRWMSRTDALPCCRRPIGARRSACSMGARQDGASRVVRSTFLRRTRSRQDSESAVLAPPCSTR